MSSLTLADAAERLFWARHTWDIPGNPQARRAYYAEMATLAEQVAQHSVDGPRTIGTYTMWNNRGVRLHGPRNHRSTSIGDVLVQADGTAWSVASFGFLPVSLVTRDASIPTC